MNANTTELENFENMSMESFEALLEESMPAGNLVGSVIKATVVNIDRDNVFLDVGLKSEGRVAVREFAPHGTTLELVIGDVVDVYLERMEDKDGMVCLSRDKARREEAWVELEKSFQSNDRVKGIMCGKVKGGFTVDLEGAIAFLPGSQVDVRPIRDVTPLMGIEQPFQILKMDRARGNIVVSRRAVLEESRAEARSELISNLEEGQVLEGIVKNITDYGAFIDLGGVDGLLHVTDISWRRVNHPSEVLEVGKTVNVRVIRYNAETQRISLGMKQLEEDPWAGVEMKYPVGMRLNGEVTNITDYGAFIELEEGVEGLAHVTDMSWTKKGAHPSQFVSAGQNVEVMIVSIDPEKRRIALGLKQCQPNPWDELKTNFNVGDTHTGEIKNITEFGLFVSMTDQIDGMVHMSDLSWDEAADVAIKNYKKGEELEVKILDIDAEKERVVLGVKQLSGDPFEESMEGVKKGAIVTCEITAVEDNGLEVMVNGEVPGYIRKVELAKDRDDRRTDRFAVGEKVDAKVTAIDRKSRRMTLSIRSREIDDEKTAMAEYGSTDSGASLGDILGAAMSKKAASKDSDTAEDKKS
ncbi:MAG: 30S ribosomal protein S1 [Alphaproteobacteria bacterium]